MLDLCAGNQKSCPNRNLLPVFNRAPFLFNTNFVPAIRKYCRSILPPLETAKPSLIALLFLWLRNTDPGIGRMFLGAEVLF